MRVVGYVRVSTEEQAEGGSLDAQRTAIERYAAMKEWEVADVVAEDKSAKDVDGRPVLGGLLSALDEGEYDALIVDAMDRLCRSVPDFYMLLDRAREMGWSLICLYPMCDMTDPYGKAMAGISAIFAQLERELNARRTKRGIAAKKAEGTYSGGRPRVIDPEVERMIHRMSGTTRAVARELNEQGIPSPTGGLWGHSTIGAIRRRA